MMHESLRLPYQASPTPCLQLGGILLNGEILSDSPVHLVLKSFSRHGLIAGATGSGKTKTIQVLSEQLSLLGVPSLVMDIKGDLSGIALPGEVTEAITKRSASLNINYKPFGFPVEFLTLSGTHPGVPLRATIAEFGPILFSRMLNLNETQEGVITILFEYAKHAELSLIDLEDIKALLQYIQTDEGGKAITSQFGGIATASASTILRKIIELESQGGREFFGAPSFDVHDLVRTNAQGLGVISILRLLDMQDKPKLFSTFMLKLLSDVYKKMPELGDPDKPKLVLFIDEAHLIFSNASKALLDMMDTIVKLIRSKGVGIIFCTQTPNDIPENILSQLGLKIQHALRAFTAKDRKSMKLIAQNFPPSEYYATEQLLTDLGIGESLLTSLDAKGQPTPLIQCINQAPLSRMGVLTDAELNQLVNASSLYLHYKTRQSMPSAKEQLAVKKKEQPVKDPMPEGASKEKEEPSLLITMSKNTLFRQIFRQIVRDMTRALMTALGMKRR